MIRISDGKFRKLSDQEQSFVDNITSPVYSDDPDGLRKAFLDAGYADTGNVLGKARNKLRDLSDHVQLKIHERIGAHVPWALEELVTLARETKNPAVKLKALQDILNRGGYAVPIRVEHHKDDPTDMTREELMKEILHLLKVSRQESEAKIIGGNECITQEEDSFNA